ncbi:2-succinyl-5-enolpyruvyl-6-hydroxy-3-cyclohexene-1-carboxylic-acid synthase [Actinotalea sp. BY-33]|uniref:2-succinyl-5-enolpyruvyl-6-hydroxy-3-cyclohexene-1-carboxylate synthase n=1 Tax=Actinotalea soli TaxID=2819234 RepID=A0A939LUM0_9CELL|nr:2-succinyl-5-enolpyruvyl-6-hydroxy-3-cyclohexene-1-carboxylic-acid synthase [Actinotalea soli]MBO1752434.1 2-succinyl-5-enolpyruvyl-6-hydroxy-3-cyclohexene-1-carboxylic-acid synthase [Actinotalea soli]
MTASGTADPAAGASTRAARVLLQALAALGVREVVLSPGSRSAPLAYAVAEAARPARERDPAAPAVALHVRIDERDAAFLALGIARGARATGDPRPVAVVTTSGTAVANLHPAVLEAHHAGLPLLLLTADRPHELRGTGANQTTQQVGLLEPVRLTLDLPAPTGRPGEDRDLRHAASRAVAAAEGARTRDPGPVHLNIALRDPLVPDGAPWPAPSRAGLVVVPGSAPSTVGPPTVELDAGQAVERTVVVAGDGAGPAARRLAEARGWPLLAEPSSGARGGAAAVAAYRLLLAHPELGGAVERAVVLGRPTLSRPVQALLAREDVETVVVAPTGRDWPDAARGAAEVLDAVPDGWLEPRAADPRHAAWLGAWQTAGRAALETVERAATGTGPTETALTGTGLARALAASLGPQDLLVVGSSNPVRDLDLVAAWDEPPTVLANRGLAGIDGTVSTAAGVALGAGRPVHALLGDLTFLHDVGGLLVGPLEARPDLTLVVANDDGGSIFATLEHGEPDRAVTFERVFATPHGADLGALCAGYGVRHSLVADRAALEAELAVPVRGVSVVEVRVNRADRRAAGQRLTRAVREAVDLALAGRSREG